MLVSLVKTTRHWHIGHNMPGYLPESDVACVDSTGDAWMVWHGDVTHALDSVEDDGMFLAVDTDRNTVTESDIDRHAGASVTFGGYTYWVESGEGSYTACDVHDDRD